MFPVSVLDHIQTVSARGIKLPSVWLFLTCRLAFMKMTSMTGPGVLGEMTLYSGLRWMPGG